MKKNTFPASNIIWRIDDRLIHGQVIIGWCGQLPIQILVVSDDEIAQTDWEKDLLLMAAPPNLPTRILDSRQTTQYIGKWIEQDKLVMVLLKSSDDLMKLINFQIPIKKVNIGGIHFREGRKEFLPYLYLSPEEITQFKGMIQKGIHFYCQDLPNSPTYELDRLIDRKK